MLGLEDILVTSTYQRNYISLYNSLQEEMIEILLEVHLPKIKKKNICVYVRGEVLVV